MDAEGWLLALTPGTLIYEKGKEGFYLVYRCVVDEYPGPWRQLNIWALDSKRCRLVKLSIESQSFCNKWAIAVNAY